MNDSINLNNILPAFSPPDSPDKGKAKDSLGIVSFSDALKSEKKKLPDLNSGAATTLAAQLIQPPVQMHPIESEVKTSELPVANKETAIRINISQTNHPPVNDVTVSQSKVPAPSSEPQAGPINSVKSEVKPAAFQISKNNAVGNSLDTAAHASKSAQPAGKSTTDQGPVATSAGNPPVSSTNKAVSLSESANTQPAHPLSTEAQRMVEIKAATVDTAGLQQVQAVPSDGPAQTSHGLDPEDAVKSDVDLSFLQNAEHIADHIQIIVGSSPAVPSDAQIPANGTMDGVDANNPADSKEDAESLALPGMEINILKKQAAPVEVPEQSVAVLSSEPEPIDGLKMKPTVSTNEKAVDPSNSPAPKAFTVSPNLTRNLPTVLTSDQTGPRITSLKPSEPQLNENEKGVEPSNHTAPKPFIVIPNLTTDLPTSSKSALAGPRITSFQPSEPQYAANEKGVEPSNHTTPKPFTIVPNLTTDLPPVSKPDPAGPKITSLQPSEPLPEENEKTGDLSVGAAPKPLAGSPNRQMAQPAAPISTQIGSITTGLKPSESKADQEAHKATKTGQESDSHQVNETAQLPTNKAGAAEGAKGLSSAPLKADVLSESIIQQVTSRIEVASKQNKTPIIVQLNPKELGQINIRLTNNPDGLRVVLDTEQASTGKLLETHLDQLKATLADVGIQISQVSIHTTNHGSTQQDGPAQQGQPGQSRRNNPSPATDEKTDRLVHKQVEARYSIIDYKV